MRINRAVLGGLFSFAIAFVPQQASAHVKWFANYDLSCRPKSMADLCQNNWFLFFFAALLPVMFFICCADRSIWGYRVHIHQPRRGLGELDPAERRQRWIMHWMPTVLRVAVGLFFLSLFAMSPHDANQPVTILTPELKTYSAWIPWLQLAVGILAMFQRTAWIAALGMAVLFIRATSQYGIFHMLDYPILLGVAVHLFVCSWWGGTYRRIADGLLRVTTAFSLMWGGIEKLVYPEWALQIIDQQPLLSLGFEHHFFVTAAAYVEFCASFVLLTGHLAARVCAVMLVGIMSLGIAVFGTVDAIGHSVILVVLLLLAAQRENPLLTSPDEMSPSSPNSGRPLQRRWAAIAQSTGFVPLRLPRLGVAYSATFAISLLGLIYAYIGGHFLAYHWQGF